LEKWLFIDIENAGFRKVFKERISFIEFLEFLPRSKFLVDKLHNIIVIFVPYALQELIIVFEFFPFIKIYFLIILSI